MLYSGVPALRNAPHWLHWQDLPFPWSLLVFELSSAILLALAPLSVLAAGLLIERSFQWVSLLRTGMITLALITIRHYSNDLFPWLLRPAPGDPHHQFLVIPGVVQVVVSFSAFLGVAWLGCRPSRHANEFRSQRKARFY
jgi:hypothetical protein